MKCLRVFITPDVGSHTSLFAVAGGGFKREDSGQYFEPVAKRGTPSKHARDDALAARLWVWTEEEMRKRKLIDWVYLPT